jgi:ribosomal protein L7/L12
MIVMPITTDAVAVSKKAVNKFIETDEYRKCENANLIFAEFLNVDGSKLFLFEPNRVFQVNQNEIDEEEFIWVSIDDEDNLAVMGQWQEFPFNFNVSTQMSIIVDDKSKVEYLIKSFDYSIIEDKAFSKICKDFMDSSLEFDDWYDETINQKALDRILKKHNQEIWNGTLEDLMKSSHEINFFKDTGFDCSNSTNSTFIGVFEPDLKQLIKYKSIIEDIIEDLPLGEKVLAYSTFDTYNYELIETLAEKETKVTGSGFDVRITGLSSSVVLNKVALLIKKTIGIGLKEAKDLLNGFQYRRRYAGVDNFLEIQKDIVKSDAIDFKTKLEEIGVQVKIVASTNATKPYINVGLDELISHPSINAYGFSGSGNNGWNGELELDKKGVSLVSLKS